MYLKKIFIEFCVQAVQIVAFSLDFCIVLRRDGYVDSFKLSNPNVK